MGNSDHEKTDRLIDAASDVENGTLVDDDRRSRKRESYEETVAFILLNPDGKKCGPLTGRALDISRGGMKVVTRQMVHIGTKGAIQLQKSQGKTVLVGVEAVHCRYVGEMEHHTGMRFIPIPNGLSGSDFGDQHCEVAGADQRRPFSRPSGDKAEQSARRDPSQEQGSTKPD